MNNESKSVYYTFFYFNNALRCYNRMKKKNANTLHLPAVISKNIQQKPMINECKSVHITFFFFFFNNTPRCYKRMKKKVNTLHLPAVMSKFIQQKPMIKECKSVHITFLFYYFNNTLRCYNRIKKKNCDHITFTSSYVIQYTKKL